MPTTTAGASAPTRPERQFAVNHILKQAEAHPAHQHLKAEVERLKRERDAGEHPDAQAVSGDWRLRREG